MNEQAATEERATEGGATEEGATEEGATEKAVTQEGVTLRAAGPGDVDAVLTFWRLAAEDTDRADTPEAVVQLLARDPYALVLAWDGGELVGSLIAGWDGWRCHLYRFAVHPERRREGIGRLLLADAEERFSQAGGRRADAMVLADNMQAHPAWSASGYAPQPQWQRWVKPLLGVESHRAE